VEPHLALLAWQLLNFRHKMVVSDNLARKRKF